VKFSVRIANPAGNITIFVLSDVPQQNYAPVAAQLLSMEEYHAEQVAFQVAPRMGAQGRIQMMGGEFCGNATRSFGYLLSTQLPGNPNTVVVEISGAEHPLTVQIDREGGRCETEMPLPVGQIQVLFLGQEYTAVCFDGIVHTIVPGEAKGEDFVRALLAAVQVAAPASAYGILFLDGENMVPVVYVCDTDSLIWESSCGSGSMAVAVFLALQQGDGEHRFALHQPGGVIEAAAAVKNGRVIHCRMGGPVSLSEEIIVTLPEF
jgi:diaminopimelate epimerase